ncbi:BZ3500_MvSof-1268-A1-R1_Chr11-2g03458 [Microbotryum saponariae]|uniref:BZ3500_MvSof-1268-A1-R1_Chr11-2g03458 protein n=1 Tax=Microbotryum saponariae TaxID=289078 RepID=A0A2X0KNI7_9BASI|nr:BZ3500_MvSof-1268-A1-R1_Chr11-2g03458 [Microbotryum saponariae]SDA03417.1 BZ3501_MvSof-1269-A2-R1_Chr11g03029 [Microbotryum saponariae]
MISKRKYNSSLRQKQRRKAEVDKKLRLLNISLCQYLQWYFNPDTTALQVLTHRPKLFNGHWPSFEHVLNLIVEVGRQSSSNGRDPSIRGLPSRSKPTYVPSHEITPDRLTSDCIDEGLDKIADDNQFLFGRIQNLLCRCADTAWREPIDGVVANRTAQDEVMEDTDGHGLQEHGTESQHRREKYLLFLSRTLMGQLAYTCNRRCNAMQHRNGFFALACGASECLTTFLQE